MKLLDTEGYLLLLAISNFSGLENNKKQFTSCSFFSFEFRNTFYTCYIFTLFWNIKFFSFTSLRFTSIEGDEIEL